MPFQWQNWLIKYGKVVVISYLVALIAISILPINGSDSTLNNTYVAKQIRLDYLLHSVLLLPWMLLRVCFVTTTPEQAWQWSKIGIGLAIVVEVAQYFLPYRTYNHIDLLANLLGIAFGFVLWKILDKLFKPADIRQ